MKNKILALVALILSLVTVNVAYGTITTDQVNLLNNKFGSIPYKVKLGTLIQNAESGGVGTQLEDGKILVGDASDLAAGVTPTGDVTITNAGVTAIEAGVIVNADVSASAALDYSKLATMATGSALIGNAGVPTATAITGDVTIGATGVTAIGANKVTAGMLGTNLLVEATGTLTAANIAAMNGAPVTLIAAAGAGKVIVVDEIEFFHDYAVAAYTSGGDVTIEYETSGLDINVFDEALVTAAADDNWLVKPLTYTSTASTASHASLTANANKAVLITNATGAFATGNVANIIKYRIRYHVVTLLT